MTEIIPFNYEGLEVRTVEQDGKVLFCGKDVAAALGYKDTINAIKAHCRGVAIHHPIIDSLGRTQQARFITEADALRLIVNSKLPTAVQFEAWLFEEVIPAVVKQGAYLTPAVAEQVLTDPDFIIRLATSLKEERAKTAALEAQAAVDAPKILFADAVAASKTSILVGELAKILRQNGVDIGQNRLFAWLRDKGYLIKRQGTDYNMPTQYSMEIGLFEIKETAITHSDGHTSVSKTPKVTGKGQQYFIDMFLRQDVA